MKIYRNSIIITGLISIVSFIVGFISKFYCTGRVAEFEYDISMGVFSGSILTLITSIVGYRIERKKVLEGIWSYTNKILHRINSYNDEMSLKEKVDFFINFSNEDNIAWNTYYGEIGFLFDWKNQTRSYIYNSIYQPIYALNEAVAKYSYNFRGYKNGTITNENPTQNYINELEALFIEKKKVPISLDESDPQKLFFCDTKHNKLSVDMKNEMNGRYYEIMYGKRRAKKEKCEWEN